MLQSATWSKLVLVVVLSVSLAGCEVIGGIFKAGVWVGALAVIVVVVGIVFAIAKVKG